MWWILWLVVCIACAAIEAATPQLTSIWFALGAAAALVTSLIAPELWWLQLIVFIAVSALALCLTRPLAKRFLNKNKVSVNADRFVGADGVVIQTINNVEGTGQVKSNGTVWSAKTESDDEQIGEGTPVVIKRIEGVKVIVALK